MSYRKINQSFWEGDLAAFLRGDAKSQALALYLITCPHANAIGCYRLSKATMSDDLGFDVTEALGRLSGSLPGEHGQHLATPFVFADHHYRMVFVVEFARHEWTDAPHPENNRVKGLVKMLPQMVSVSRKSFVWKHFAQRYGIPWGIVLGKLLDELVSTPEVLRDDYGSALQVIEYETPRARARARQDQDQDQDQESPLTPQGGKRGTAKGGTKTRPRRKIPEVDIPAELSAIGIDQEAFKDRVLAMTKTKPVTAWQTELNRLVPMIEECAAAAVLETFKDATASGWQGCTPKMVRDAAGRNGNRPEGGRLIVPDDPYAESDRQETEAQSAGKCTICLEVIKERGLWVEKFCLRCDLTHYGPGSQDPAAIYAGFKVEYGSDGRVETWEAP